MDLKDIKAIIDLMKKNSLSEFELEKQDFKIKLKRGPSGFVAAPIEETSGITYALPAQVNSVSASLPPAGGALNTVNSATDSSTEIKSPMIGTIYRSPSPESDEYVTIGSEVNAETVVCLIEAMKVMNEIKAEVRGVITQILVDNAKPVEFGQPLFKIKPA